MTAVYRGAGFMVNGERVFTQEPMGERPAKVGDAIQIGDWAWASENLLTIWSERVFVDPDASPPVRVMVPHGTVLEVLKPITVVIQLPGGFKDHATVPVGRYTLEIGDELERGERRLTDRSLVPLGSDADPRFQLGIMQMHSWPVRVVSVPEGAALRTA